MKAVASGQETIAAQQLTIEELQGESGRNRIGENCGASKKFVVKPPQPEFYKGKRDALEINAWVDMRDILGYLKECS
jgi:hypothetical protein